MNTTDSIEIIVMSKQKQHEEDDSTDSWIGIAQTIKNTIASLKRHNIKNFDITQNEIRKNNKQVKNTEQEIKVLEEQNKALTQEIVSLKDDMSQVLSLLNEIKE